MAKKRFENSFKNTPTTTTTTIDEPCATDFGVLSQTQVRPYKVLSLVT
jgi:hypothetical protein